ncbi:MAG: BACON domain-containing protein, partial [Alistipes sp.]|nr:BACON domain-containing protein [Alistipes sp.]
MMKLRRLFFALLTLPLAFAACEHEPPPTPEPEPNMTTVLTLTSEDTLDFTAEGGQGVIEYELVEETRNKPVPMPMVEATCEVDWVTDIAVADDITFNVAANEGEARATKVVVTYGSQAFEVVVNQAAKAAEPDPKPVYVMDVQLAAAMRIPSAELDLPNNIFALVFVDDTESLELGIVLAGITGDTVLKAGNYNTESETLYADESALHLYDTDTEYAFASGFVAVSLDGDSYAFDIEFTVADGKLYHFTYEGVVMDMEPAEKPEPQEFNPVKVEAYRADSWDLGNFELDLYINDELYHSLDMQDLINPNDGHLTAGHYSMNDGSITQWSNFVRDIETGEGAYMTAAEIDVTHYEDGTTSIKGFFESEYGDHLDIDWTGVVAGFVFGGTTPEPPTPGEGD